VLQAICPLSVVPVRKDPSDRAEMVTQWLFGETAEVLDEHEKWSLLRFTHDQYEGWVDNKQWAENTEDPDRSPSRSAEAFVPVMLKAGPMILPFGSVLPKNIPFAGRTLSALQGTPVQRLLSIQDAWINAPYLWGGRSPLGVDCSGLTQLLFLAAAVQLPRDAYQQAEIGTSVDLIDLAAAGDLAFFDNAEGRIIHVGIVLDDRRIFHASGRVRIDTLDQQGIFNADEGISCG
jgi:hypothetical protein